MPKELAKSIEKVQRQISDVKPKDEMLRQNFTTAHCPTGHHQQVLFKIFHTSNPRPAKPREPDFAPASQKMSQKTNVLVAVQDLPRLMANMTNLQVLKYGTPMKRQNNENYG